MNGLRCNVPGDFGTVIVHDNVETAKTATLTTLKSVKESSPALRHAGSLSVSGVGDKEIDSWYSSPFISNFFHGHLITNPQERK